MLGYKGKFMSCLDFFEILESFSVSVYIFLTIGMGNRFKNKLIGVLLCHVAQGTYILYSINL